MASLVFKVGKKEVASLELLGSTVIGRSPDCRVSVQDRLLSRRHLQLEPTSQGWAAVDLGSANGTRVDGESITRHELSDGDLIELGHITIVYLEDSLAVDDADDAPGQIVIKQSAFAPGPLDLPTRTIATHHSPSRGETASERSVSSLSGSMTAMNYTPPEVLERAKRWEEAAVAHTPIRMQPPTLAERFNKMPRAVALSAVALTGLVLFSAAFYLTSMLTR